MEIVPYVRGKQLLQIFGSPLGDAHTSVCICRVFVLTRGRAQVCSPPLIAIRPGTSMYLVLLSLSKFVACLFFSPALSWYVTIPCRSV